MVESLSAVEDMVVVDARHAPAPEHRATYAALGEAFNALYQRLGDVFDELAALTGAVRTAPTTRAPADTNATAPRP
jgi:hypothetical protein